MLFSANKTGGKKVNNCKGRSCNDCEYQIYGDVCAEKLERDRGNPSEPDGTTGKQTREEILELAKKCVCQDRQDRYGNLEDNFGTIANYWAAYLQSVGIKDLDFLDSYDVANMMVLLKVARCASNPRHKDNWIDIAGYAACGGELSDVQE